MKKIVILVSFIVLTLCVNAQIQTPVKWKIETKKVQNGVYDIICKAKIDSHWHLYDTSIPKGGPLPTTFNIDEDETKNIQLLGKFKADKKAKEEKSDAFNMIIKYFDKEVVFKQRVKVKGNIGRLVGYVEFMACSGSQCIPPGEADFDFKLTK